MKPSVILAFLCAAVSARAADYPAREPVKLAAFATGPVAWLVVEDFDRDGRPDVVVPINGNQLQCFTGSAGDTFSSHAPFGLSLLGAIHAVAVDVDFDSDLDLVVARHYTGVAGSVQVWLNDGHAQFTAGPVRSMGFSFQNNSRLTAADVNADGRLDLIAGSEDAAQLPAADAISWLRGDGAGGFDAPVLLSINHPMPCGSCAEDFNRDGKMDFVITAANPARVLRFNGDDAGQFAVPAALPLPEANAVQALTADFDRDGWPDLLVRASDAGTNFKHRLTWRRNLGGGAFGTPVLIVEGRTDQVLGVDFSDHLSGAVLSDADNDGDTDVEFLTRPTGGFDLPRLSWAANDGAGNFASPERLADVPGCRAVAAADTDLDGDDDWLVLTDGGLFRVENILRQRNILHTENQRLEAAHDVTDLVPGDFDGDGDVDVLALRHSGTNTFLLFRNTNGLLALDLTPGPVPTPVLRGTAGDFDDDGDLDVAAIVPGIGVQGNRVYRFLNNGSASFTVEPTFIDAGSNLLTADVDRNGTPDLVYSINDKVYLTRFGHAPLSWAAPGFVSGLWAGDWHSGGAREIVFQTSLAESRVGLMAMDGTQSVLLDHQPALTNGTYHYGVTCADTTGTGRPGVCQAIASDTLRFYTQDSDGGLHWDRTIIGARAAELRTADLGRNGRQQVLVTAAAERSILSSDDTGLSLTVNGRNRPAGSPVPRHTCTADLNRDGRMDIVYLDADDAPGAADKVVTLRHVGGEYESGLAAGDGPASVPAGSRHCFATWQSKHFGKRGDEAYCLRNFRVSFRGRAAGGAFVPLTQSQAAQVVEDLTVYRQQPGSESIKLLVGGGSLNLVGGDYVSPGLSETDLQVAGGDSMVVRFYVRLKASALTSGLHQLEVTLLTPNGLPAKLQVVGSPEARIRNTDGGPAYYREIITIVPPSPLDLWRQGHFGLIDNEGIGANSADPDGDGFTNLLEYAQGTNPNVRASGGGLSISFNAAKRPMLSFQLASPARPDVRVKVEMSTALEYWLPMSTRAGAGAWTGGWLPAAGPVLSGIQYWNLTHTSVSPLQEKYFYRLAAETIP